jgi:hypothetical protein
MKKLESNRKNGRDDYAVRAMWNSMLAGVVFEHKGIEPLSRELKRNPSLLEICGEILIRQRCFWSMIMLYIITKELFPAIAQKRTKK